MSTRKTTFFYAALIAVVSLAIGMVIASRLDMAPRSEAQALAAPPPMNSAPLSGPVDAGTFRGIAHEQSPMVVSISTTSTRTTDASDDQSDELFRRFFGTPRQQIEADKRPAVFSDGASGDQPITAVISGAEQDIKRVWDLSDVLHGIAIGVALYGTVAGALRPG